MTRSLFLSPNTKNIGIGKLDEFMEWVLRQSSGADSDTATAYQRVAWMFRGVELRAQGVSTIPFIIEDANTGKEIDNSTAYKNVVEFLPRPKALLKLTEASRTLTGTAYLANARNRIMTKSVRFLVPTSIRPKITSDGLEYFERDTERGTVQLDTDAVVYSWMLDAFVELGPPKAYPAQAALSAAGVLLNLDRFVEMFFQRGAIKATILGVQGNPPKEERAKIKAFWQDLMTGIKNAFAAEVYNVEAIKPVVVGEGVKELENQALSEEKRHDIAGALMIPQTILFSGDASGIGGGGVVTQDALNFLNQCVIPEFDAIAEDWNEQLFLPNGYRLKPTYENLDAFHDDEAALAGTATSYADLLDKCKTFEEWQLVTAMSGVEYDETMARKVFTIKDANRARMEMQTQPNQPPEPANMTVTKPEPKQLTDGTDSAVKSLKDMERRQFKVFAAKRPETDWDHFQFKYLSTAEQYALGVKKNEWADMKSIAGVVSRFRRDWVSTINLYFLGGEIRRADLSEIISKGVLHAYTEGLLEAGVVSDEITAEDYAVMDVLTNEQLQHLDGFLAAVKEAKGDETAQAGILSRADLWVNSIQQIGENARNAALDGLFEFVLVGDASEESCETCQKLLGKRHRWSWIEKNGMQVKAGNGRFVCQCFNCPHAWEPVKKGE